MLRSPRGSYGWDAWPHRFVVAAGLGLALVAPASGRERAVAPALEPCPAQGAGFVRVPGSGTCLRLSGRVAAGLATQVRGPGAPLAIGRLSIDTRTTTDYGPVRTFVRMGSDRTFVRMGSDRTFKRLGSDRP